MDEPRSPAASPRRARRLLPVILVAFLLLIAGGWWLHQVGLATQTSTSAAAGFRAPPSQPGLRQNGIPSGAGAFTGTVPFSGTLPGEFPPGSPPGSLAPGQASAAATAGTAGIGDSASGSPAAATAMTFVIDATPEAVSTSNVTIPALAGVKGSQLLDDSGKLLALLEPGDSVLITGRADDNTWLAVIGGAGEGWIAAGQIVAFGLNRLPIVDLPAAVAAAADLSAPAVMTVLGSRVMPAISTMTNTTGTPAKEATTAKTTAAPALVDTPLATAPGSEAAASPAAVVATDQGRLNIRSGPGTAYPVLVKAPDGAACTVTGRNATGDWLQLRLDDGTSGWAAAAYLKVDGAIGQLPIRLAPAPPVQDGTGTVTLVSSTAPAASQSSAAASAAPAAAAAAGDLSGILVFQQSPGGMIYAYDLASGQLWPLTNGFDPAISPDGSTVAFTRDGGETGLYLIQIDGTDERRIFERSALSSPKWSPDGRSIVFSRNDEGVECYQVMPNYCMLPDEAKKRFPMGVPATIPLVTEYQYKLSAVNAGGSSFHDIAALNSARAPDWSDGGIVYQSSAGIQLTADTENAANQTVAFDNLNPYYYDPDLQPGGGQIVFQIKGAAQTDLWVVNTDGSGRTALTQPKTTLVDSLPSNVAAAYSPDGQSIVFLSNRTASSEAGDWHLWVMNADGSNQRQLPIDLAIHYTYGDDQVVSWGG